MTHQKVALKWLLDQHTKGYGSILADEMGLGKTISAIALIVTLRQTFPRTGPILIVCPATVIKQWEQEIRLWTNDTSFSANVYTFTEAASKTDKRKLVQKVFGESAILVVSYESMRIDGEQLSPCTDVCDQWYYVILDEA